MDSTWIIFGVLISFILAALLYLFLSKYSIKDTSFDDNKAKKRSMIKKHNDDFRTLQDKSKDKKSKKQKKLAQQKVQQTVHEVQPSQLPEVAVDATDKEVVEDSFKPEKPAKNQPKAAAQASKKDKSKKGPPPADKIAVTVETVSVAETAQQITESVAPKKTEKEIKKAQNEKEPKKVIQKLVPETKAAPPKESGLQVTNELTNGTSESIKSDVPKSTKESNDKMKPVSVPTNSVKHSNKKKRMDSIGLHLIGSSKEAITINVLVPLIQKAELSKSEIQFLIDALLNKQQEDIAEWFSGRQDPLVKLKKQLAEKESALKDEQEVTSGLQIKLKELRTELNAEKSVIRQLEENMNLKQGEINALNAKLVAVREETQAITLQGQQLQKQLSEERLTAMKLKEEQAIHQKITHDKHLETVALQSQVNQLDSQLHEQQEINASMAAEMQRLQESLRIQEVAVLEKKLQEIKNEKEELTSLISKQNTDIRNYHNDNERLVMEITTLQRITEDNHVEREKHLKHISNLEGEVKKLNECVSLAVLNATRNRDNYSNSLTGDSMENGDCHSSVEKKKGSLDELNDRIKALNDELHSKEIVIEELKKEMAGKETDGVCKQKKLEEILSQNSNLLSSLDVQNKAVSQLQATLKEKEDKIVSLQNEIVTSRELASDLKNKNWRVTESLENAEKSLEHLKSQLHAVTESKERLENMEASQEKLQVDEFLSNLISNILSNECEENIQILLKNLEEAILFVRNNKGTSISQLESKNTQLESLVSYYKSIISDTEGMLNSLQLHVEVEETRWKEKIQLLEEELSRLKK